MQRDEGGGAVFTGRACLLRAGQPHDLFQHSQTLRGRPCCVHCPDSREEREDEHPRHGAQDGKHMGSRAQARCGQPAFRHGADLFGLPEPLTAPVSLVTVGDPSVPHASTQGTEIYREWKNDFFSSDRQTQDVRCPENKQSSL